MHQTCQYRFQLGHSESVCKTLRHELARIRHLDPEQLAAAAGNRLDRDVELRRHIRDLPLDVDPRRVRIAREKNRGHTKGFVPGVSHGCRRVITLLLVSLVMLHGAFYRHRCHHQRQFSTQQGIEIGLREVAFPRPYLEQGIDPALGGIWQADAFQ
jgi:hypothetical protein